LNRPSGFAVFVFGKPMNDRVQKIGTGYQVFIAWETFQRRQISMAPYLGFEPFFLPLERRAGKLRKLFIYLGHAWRTLEILISARPDVVWVQLPQVPLLWVALLYRRLVNCRSWVVADCHNKMFRPPWSKFPFGIRLLPHCNLVLVHNDDVFDVALSMGIPRRCLEVVEDPPAVIGSVTGPLLLKDIPRPWFVFPASFAEDEPLGELLAAAGAVPDVSFIVTGNVRDCRETGIVRSAPTNVHFAGFLSKDEFDGLISGCDAIVALTRFDGIQLSVCGEAVGAAKPMLISDTKTLRRLFPKGTVFVRSDDPAAIAAGVKQLLARLPELRETAQAQRQEISARWMTQRGMRLMELLSTALCER